VSQDEDARLSRLHEIMAVDLLNYFVRRVATRDDAADLLAETFLVAWQRISRLPSKDEDARMWMFVTARNVHRNYQRGARRREQLADRLRLDLSASAAPEFATGDKLDVRAAVGALPDDQRELVMLIHWEGFTLPEAARISGTRESTARGRYQRARASLQARLKTKESVTHA
jgi:RNA polymerase sigma-70 factor (ECF subfamily)